ncbi:hypothetical protein CRYUN_Cryun14cG0025800 [Craigia yunnanensis]
MSSSLKPPTSLVIFGDHFFNPPKFHFLKAYESPLPLPQLLLAHAQSLQAILSSGGAPVTADTIRLLPHPRMVVTTSQGLNHIDLSECRRRGIAVAGGGTIFFADWADSEVGLLIDVLRKVSDANRFVKQGLWSSPGEYPLGFKVVSFLPTISNFGEGTEMDMILKYSSGCTRSHVSTGKQGIIINIARGTIINEKEMVECLVQGEIGGAGLDVFENEPNVPKELFDWIM